MIREPIAAGSFYPASENALRKVLTGFIDSKKRKINVKGAVIPHAGYIYSGETAGAVYSRIVIPETVIILGPNHTGQGKPYSIQTEGGWKTPLGNAGIDTALAEEMLEMSSLLERDDKAHKNEHSIEVQIPFLQYLKSSTKIVPIILSSCGADECHDLGRSIAEAVSKIETDTVIIASSDMTHYEEAEEARRKDMIAIEAVKKLDEDELIKLIREFNITMCGYIPTAVMLNACRRLGAKSAEVIGYANSGEVSGDMMQVVGYAGIIVK